MIKLRTLRRGDCPGLSDGPDVTNKGPDKNKAGRMESEKRMELKQRVE